MPRYAVRITLEANFPTRLLAEVATMAMRHTLIREIRKKFSDDALKPLDLAVTLGDVEEVLPSHSKGT